MNPNGFLKALIGFGTLVVLLSLFMPWLTIMGVFSIKLTNIYDILFRLTTGGSLPNSLMMPQLGSYLTSTIWIMITIILYPIAVILGFVGIVSRKSVLLAGILAVATGVSWVLGVYSLKASSLVTTGYGSYVVIIEGIVIMIGYYVNRPRHDKFSAED